MLNRLNGEASWTKTILPELPHGGVGRFDVTPVAIAVKECASSAIPPQFFM